LKSTAPPSSGCDCAARFADETAGGNAAQLELEAFLRNLPGCSDVNELLDRLQCLLVKN